MSHFAAFWGVNTPHVSDGLDKELTHEAMKAPFADF